jgi:hypothetical protein
VDDDTEFIAIFSDGDCLGTGAFLPNEWATTALTKTQTNSLLISAFERPFEFFDYGHEHEWLFSKELLGEILELMNKFL